jgi:hypothetical protein
MKCHLVNDDEPVKLGTDLTAICGALVSKAESNFGLDIGNSNPRVNALSEFLTSLNTCSKCLKYPLLKRYVYGVVPGQEAKHGEAA